MLKRSLVLMVSLLGILGSTAVYSMESGDQDKGSQEAYFAGKRNPTTSLGEEDDKERINYFSSLPDETVIQIILSCPPKNIAILSEVDKRFYVLTRTENVWKNAWIQVGLSDASYPLFHRTYQWDIAEQGFLIGRAQRNEPANAAVLALLPQAEA